MIPFMPKHQPSFFYEITTVRGQRWLERNKLNNDRPEDYWSEHRDYLAECFRHLCAYAAIRIEKGTFDHYLSCKNKRERAYDWFNYRYICGIINSSKQAIDEEVLDPFEVKEGWFEVLLPSFELTLTNKLTDSNIRKRAELTILRLHLNENFIEPRKQWYNQFLTGKQSLSGLLCNAPLVGQAVYRVILTVKSEFQGNQWYQMLLNSEINFTALERQAPVVDEVLRRLLPPPAPPAPPALARQPANSSRRRR